MFSIKPFRIHYRTTTTQLLYVLIYCTLQAVWGFCFSNTSQINTIHYLWKPSFEVAREYSQINLFMSYTFCFIFGFSWCSGEVSACRSSCDGWRVPSLLKAAQLQPLPGLPAPHHPGKRWGLCWEAALLVDPLTLFVRGNSIFGFLLCSTNVYSVTPPQQFECHNVTYVQVSLSSHPEVGNLKFHRYSQEKTLSWLKKKVLVWAVSLKCQIQWAETVCVCV